MQIRLGYELNYCFPQPTSVILALSIHYSRTSDIIIPDYLTTDPSVPIGGYRDGFGNWCTRIVAPGRRIRIKTDALIRDTGQPDRVAVQMIEDYYGHITPVKNGERILQGIPGWEPIADASGDKEDGVNAGGAGKRPAKPRTKK